VLEELRVPVDCLVGTSVGAIIGASYAAGRSPAEIERMIRGADWDRLLSDDPPRAQRSAYAKELERSRVGRSAVGVRNGQLVLPQGMVVGHDLQFFLQEMVRPAEGRHFDQLVIPYRAVATDFESGAMVVLDRGDLASAMRASMSVPGAFAPVERDGRILVDGGLVRNLPIDVARRDLGAEVVIAVNLSAPLLKRDRLGSLLSAAEQTVNILIEQNVRVSLGQLGPRDVLIAPQTGDLATSDFAHSSRAIPVGAAAARRVADRLAAYAVDERAWATWRDAQRRTPTERRIDQLRVDTSGFRYVAPAAVEALVAETGGPKDPAHAIDELLATDDFERIGAHTEQTPEGTTLVLQPFEKSWGPNYLAFGLGLSSDLEGRSDFSVYLDHRATWLSRRGLEWRNRASLGQVTGITSELRQPLDRARYWFLAPRLEFLQDERTLYVEDEAIAAYRNRRGSVALDLGRRLGTHGEIRAGLMRGSSSEERVTGAPLLPDLARRVVAWRGSAVVDRLDSLDFPQDGYLGLAEGRFARRIVGGDERYDRAAFEWQQAFGRGATSVLLSVRHFTSFGSRLPLYDAFQLGGFLNLSGYQSDELLVSRSTLVRGIYRHRLGEVSTLLPGLYLGASFEAADVAARLNGAALGRTVGGSLFLSAESVVGPFYLGFGHAEGGRSSLYLFLGRP
jgi:NTE family protein